MVEQSVNEHSLFGLGAGMVCAVVVGYLAGAAGAPGPVQGTIASTALGIPAAIDYHVKSRNRDPGEDIHDIRHRGVLQRPTGLVIAILAAVILLADSIGGALMALLGGSGISGHGNDIVTYLCLALIVLAVAVFTSRAVHYFRDHPYLWTTAAVVLAAVLRFIIVATLWSKITADIEDPPSVTSMIPSLFIGYGILWVFAVAGAIWGMRRHDKWLRTKLAKLEQQPRAAAQTWPQQQPAWQPPQQPAWQPPQPQPAPTGPPSGWYADPEGLQNIERWWDGTRWSDSRRNKR